MFLLFIYSFRKTKALKRITKKLAYGNFDLTNPLERLLSYTKDYQENALQEMIDYLRADKVIAKLLYLRRVSDEDIKIIYKKLCEFGAAQYIKGHYIAISSFFFVDSLVFIFAHYDLNEKIFKVYDLNPEDSIIAVVINLCNYFK